MIPKPILWYFYGFGIDSRPYLAADIYCHIWETRLRIGDDAMEYDKAHAIDGTNIRIVLGNITRADTDAIVNAANERLLGGGGVDGAIWMAAGPDKMYAQCKDLGGCKPGHAKITAGCDLPARYVIHAVGPRFYELGEEESEKLLTGCYRESLELAEANGCKTITFPAISCGVFGYPLEEAIAVAYQACLEYGSGMNAIDLIFLFDDDYEDAVDALESYLDGMDSQL